MYSLKTMITGFLVIALFTGLALFYHNQKAEIAIEALKPKMVETVVTPNDQTSSENQNGAGQDNQTTSDTQESLVTPSVSCYSFEAPTVKSTITVQVEVSDGKITNITATDPSPNNAPYLSKAVKIIPTILESQCTEVDTVSGATVSSNAILDAVDQVLSMQ